MKKILIVISVVIVILLVSSCFEMYYCHYLTTTPPEENYSKYTFLCRLNSMPAVIGMFGMELVRDLIQLIR